MTARFTVAVTAPGLDRLPISFEANSAAEAYDLVLSKAVYDALEVKVTDEKGKEIGLDELSKLANRLAE